MDGDFLSQSEMGGGASGEMGEAWSLYEDGSDGVKSLAWSDDLERTVEDIVDKCERDAECSSIVSSFAFERRETDVIPLDYDDMFKIVIPMREPDEDDAMWGDTRKSFVKGIRGMMKVDFESILVSISMAFTIIHARRVRALASSGSFERGAGAERSADDGAMRRWTPRITGYRPLTKFHDVLKTKSADRFVAVRGNVVRVSAVRPKLVKMVWHCSLCGGVASRMLEGGVYATKGLRCPDPECKGKGSTSLVPQPRIATTIDWQAIRLQEGNDDGDVADAGRTPRSVECDLHSDLCDGVVPGDTVTLCGIVRQVEQQQSRGRRGKQTGLYVLRLHVHSILKHRAAEPTGGTKRRAAASEMTSGSQDSADGGGSQGDADGGETYSKKDKQFIVAVAERILDPTKLSPFELLVASLCPDIFGQTRVKAGLILSLLGGTAKFTDEVEKVAVRGDLHCLIVGDPGLGKSELLKAASNVSPRGVYVCGNTASATGLTVTMVRDPVTGDFALEAGALVISDRGVCCIDEFDKMGCDQQALLEAMEQQRISIAKAGIVCSLSARTAVIAAANPVHGHYDKCKTIGENLKMAGPLLSRFDLIFILVDKSDRHKDRMLAKHIIGMHSKHKKATTTNKKHRASSSSSSSSASAARGGGDTRHDYGAQADVKRRWKQQGQQQQRRDRGRQADENENPDEALSNTPFLDKLEKKVEHSKRVELLPPALTRKYLAYARKYVRPKLSAVASEVLQTYYLHLRQTYSSDQGVPCTTRQLESLIRLAQARAKADLCELVSESHAKEVVELMNEALFAALEDGDGNFDTSRGQFGSNGSNSAIKVERTSLYNTSPEITAWTAATQDVY